MRISESYPIYRELGLNQVFSDKLLRSVQKFHRTFFIGPEAMKNENTNDRIYSKGNPDFNTLSEMLLGESKNFWAIGDELGRLKALTYKIKDIAGTFQRSYQRLSEYHKTAYEFPIEVRDYEVNFTDYETARKVHRQLGEALEMDMNTLRKEITRLGFTKSKTAMRHFGGEVSRLANLDNLIESEQKMLQRQGLVNTCNLGPFQNVIKDIDRRMVQIFHADPPFANFTKTRSGEYYGDNSCGRSECANMTHDEALVQTVDSINAAQQVLVTGGVLLLWQSSRPLRMSILQAIEDAGMEVEEELVWAKGHCKLENPESCYASSSERCLVVKRKGEILVNHDPSLARENVITFEPLRMDSRDPYRHHAFQKPQDLCEYLVRKHSYEGDVVFDAFGCSGSFCVASIKLNRHWIYCEEHDGEQRDGTKDPMKSNFKFGCSNINLALEEKNKGELVAA